MRITINNRQIETLEGETLLEAARREGISIPSICYAKGAKHISSCMVCAVKNCQNGQIIPSCTTLPTEGMCIDTESEEVQQVRTLSLELLLSDHRADCEAPCVLVCPKGLDIERMLGYYDEGDLVRAYSVLSEAFDLPTLGCDGCKAPCEKVCRRGTVDKGVEIRAIIRSIVEKASKEMAGTDSDVRPDKQGFISKLGRFSAEEKAYLKENVKGASRCLHCACGGRSKCLLRACATGTGIKRSRYDATSNMPAGHKIHVVGNLWFEPAKCVRCGLCVYNTENGFTFRNRGFGMEVLIPEENKNNVDEHIARLCPTGALYVKAHERKED